MPFLKRYPALPTGSSILRDVEAMEHSMLFCQRNTPWVGGMGVLVFTMAVLPVSDGAPCT